MPDKKKRIADLPRQAVNSKKAETVKGGRKLELHQKTMLSKPPRG
jgi:hypothetical protein